MPTQEIKRKLTAILSADVKGYSRLMSEDEKGTVRTLNAYKEVMAGLIQHHHGRVVDSTGDNLMAEFASVVDAAERGVALVPNSVAAQFLLGYFLYSTGRDEEAIPILKKAVALSPIPLPRALSHLCICSRKARRHEEAVAVCRQLLQREPNHLLAHLTLAATFVEMEKMEEARTEMTEVLRIDPKYTVKLVPRSFPWKDQAEIDRLIDSLSKAGLK
jgi:tetratricopeptide (TPR) repeat protein